MSRLTIKTSCLSLTIVVILSIVAVQTIYSFAPVGDVRLFDLLIRPATFAVLAVACVLLQGIDKRSVRKANIANMVAILSVVLSGIVILISAFIFGVGRNMMTVSASVVFQNLWQRGFIIITGEIIRYKLIKAGEPDSRYRIAAIFGIVLAFANMTEVRALLADTTDAGIVFFDSIFLFIVISLTAGYFAVEGSFFSAITISFIYIMMPYLLPVMPSISPVAWSLVISTVLFLATFFYRILVLDKSKHYKQLVREELKNLKRPGLRLALRIANILVLVTFLLGLLPIYPLVILTDSMSGTVERGSIVFVQRIPDGQTYDMVREGEIVHFLSRTGVDYVHRVTEFVYEDGERLYQTQGDNSELPDSEPIPQEDVLGIVRTSLPIIGFPYLLFQDFLFGVVP